MSAPSPVAVGYVCAPEGDALEGQRDAVTDYARVEGLALAQIVTDRFDTFTISQVVQTAKFHNARLVILPAQARLASVRRRVALELEPDGATCVVIGDARPNEQRPARLTDSLPRRTPPTTTAAPSDAAADTMETAR
ncbi:hypothetical protein [Antribacter gilvus]|uniref:hypothetical protein n=1 Tax=Antribacter gilvus TaxID=2304675 RepID=UPI000F7867B7|nr:hypothetical protein [Antribacter gilvus]